VIAPALRGERTGAGPVIVAGDCTLCGACIDVCPERVFRFATRFDQRLDPAAEAHLNEPDHSPAREAA
jgi:ferredoxin-type protein NapH